MNKWIGVGILATVTVATVASADDHRKPGLWQSTMQVNFTKGGPTIPPEQLAKMQQLGISVPGMGGGPQTIKTCLTPEQAARGDMDSGRGDCQMQNKTWSGNTFNADLICTSRQGNVHGHIHATEASDTGYTADSHLEGTNPQLGGDFAMDNHIVAEWQGADCGSVRPMGQHN